MGIIILYNRVYKCISNMYTSYVKNHMVGGLAQAVALNMRSTHKEKLTQEHTKRDGSQKRLLASFFFFLLVKG